jgi:MoxR-like ATPase
MFTSVEEVQETLARESYISDRALALTIYLAHKLQKPLFLEGEAGVGKTDVAKVLANALGTRLIRLQCYEGLDANAALYEWNYAKQILYIRMEERWERSKVELAKTIFSEEFLLRRPLLDAIHNSDPTAPVLLIDEIDRADEEFEAFLLEVLSDFQVTIPEIGTFQAKHYPFVVLTSNRTRDISDALKRRCLYHWIDYPSFEKERMIVRKKVPDLPETLTEQICQFMQRLRNVDFYKKPGVAETLDWARALAVLGHQKLGVGSVEETMGCLLKYSEDMNRLREEKVETLLKGL